MTHRYEVLIRDGEEDVTVVDTFDHYEDAKDLARELRDKGERPIILPVSVREAG